MHSRFLWNYFENHIFLVEAGLIYTLCNLFLISISEFVKRNLTRHFKNNHEGINYHPWEGNLWHIHFTHYTNLISISRLTASDSHLHDDNNIMQIHTSYIIYASKGSSWNTWAHSYPPLSLSLSLISQVNIFNMIFSCWSSRNGGG